MADERPLSIAREGMQIMARVAVIYYLSQQPVRDWFASGVMILHRHLFRIEAGRRF